MNKHAYMIMAHHRPDILQLLINALDDERNDIIIHIDKKSSMQANMFHCKRANLLFVESMNVNWAGYSQVECEYKLLKKAVEVGKHSYYHFLTGVNYPLWNQDYIHNYFNENIGTQYVGFDSALDFSERAMYYVPFSEYGKLKGIKGKIIYILRSIILNIQKLLKVNRLKDSDYIIKKGCAYFSITEELVLEILKMEPIIKNMLKHTICCDEIFVQTVTYNSKFRDSIKTYDNEWDGCLREFAWPSNIAGDHFGWNFSLNDLSHLLSSNRIFAMKFESEDGLEIIDTIKKNRNIL